MSVATPPATDRFRESSYGARAVPVRRRFAVRGVVQGVGFRPFVWNLAQRLELSGWVQNTSGAVIVEAEGAPLALDSFALALRSAAPRLARVESVESAECAAVGDTGFHIVESRSVAGEYQPIAPDAATCPECVADIRDPVGPALPLSVHQLHELWSAFHHHRGRSLRPAVDDDASLHHVRRVPRGVRRPWGPSLPCAADRVSRMRPAALVRGRDRHRARRRCDRAGLCRDRPAVRSSRSKGWADSNSAAMPGTTMRCDGSALASTVRRNPLP